MFKKKKAKKKIEMRAMTCVRCGRLWLIPTGLKKKCGEVKCGGDLKVPKKLPEAVLI